MQRSIKVSCKSILWDTMVLIGMVKHSQSSPNSKFSMSLQYLKQKVKVDFLYTDKHHSWFNTLGIKVFVKLILSLLMYLVKHSQSTQSDKFATSSQCPKKEVKDEVHFLHADKHQSFYKLPLSFLMEVAFCSGAKYSDIFRGSSHVFCYLFSFRFLSPRCF